MKQRPAKTPQEIYYEYILPVAVEVLKHGQNIKFEDAESGLLWHRDAGHSSIDLIAFIVELEQRLTEDLKFTIRLLSEKAFSQTKSPFVNLKTLSTFTAQLVNEATA